MLTGDFSFYHFNQLGCFINTDLSKADMLNAAPISIMITHCCCCVYVGFFNHLLNAFQYLKVTNNSCLELESPRIKPSNVTVGQCSQ